MSKVNVSIEKVTRRVDGDFDCAVYDPAFDLGSPHYVPENGNALPPQRVIPVRLILELLGADEANMVPQLGFKASRVWDSEFSCYRTESDAYTYWIPFQQWLDENAGMPLDFMLAEIINALEHRSPVSSQNNVAA